MRSGTLFRQVTQSDENVSGRGHGRLQGGGGVRAGVRPYHGKNDFLHGESLFSPYGGPFYLCGGAFSPCGWLFLHVGGFFSSCFFFTVYRCIFLHVVGGGGGFILHMRAIFWDYPPPPITKISAGAHGRGLTCSSKSVQYSLSTTNISMHY